MNQIAYARLRAIIEAAAQEGFCVIVSGKNDGPWTARAFCIGNYKEDFVETGGTENAAIEAVAKRLDGRKRQPAGSRDAMKEAGQDRGRPEGVPAKQRPGTEDRAGRRAPDGAAGATRSEGQ